MDNRPGVDATLIDIAHVIARRSTCPRLAVGVVIARDTRVITTGYNGSPSGMAHCVHTTNASCTVSVHAEVNAIAFAARYGLSTDGATLYSTHTPCLACAKLIINAGLSRVVYDREYRSADGVRLLTAAGVDTAALAR